MNPAPNGPGSKRRFAAAPQLGDLALLLEGGASNLLRRSGVAVAAADPTYVRLKPDTSALVGFTLVGLWADGTPLTLPAYVRTFPDERGAALAGKWASMRPTPSPLGPGVQLLAGGRSVLFVFPNDARLRGLRFVSDIDKMKRFLPELPAEAGLPGFRVRGRRSTIRTVRYKPERRFVGAAHFALRNDSTGQHGEASAFVRFFPDRRGRTLADVVDIIRLSAGEGLVPRVLAVGLDGRLMAEEAITGKELFDAVVEEGWASDTPESVAFALARLHRSGARLPARVEPQAVLRAVADGWASMWTFDPSLRPDAERLLRRLAGMVPPEAAPVPIHGDLHLHQILLTAAGSVLVDLERSDLGHPAQDLAGLQAHTRMLASDYPGADLQSLENGVVEAYDRLVPDQDPGHRPFFLGCALMNRALLSFRGLEERWDERARAALSLTAEATAGTHRAAFTGTAANSVRPPVFFRHHTPQASGHRWEVFYPRREGPWGGYLEDDHGHRTYGFYQPDGDRFRPVAMADDPALPRLAEWAGAGELVSYRPGRRATVRLTEPGGQDTFAKLVPPRKAARLLALTRAAAALRGRGGTDVPALARIRGFSIDDGILVFEGLSGRSLHARLMEEPSAQSEHQAELDAVARSLAALHAVRTPELPEARPGLDPAEYAEIALGHFPEREQAVREALDELSGLVPTAPTVLRPVHGDLHDRNILLNGDRVALLDLDMLHAGDPADDVGNLAAHLVLRALQSGASLDVGRRQAMHLVHGYRRIGGPAAPVSVAAACARALFRLSCLYLFRRRWQGLTPLLVEEAVRWTKRDLPAMEEVA